MSPGASTPSFDVVVVGGGIAGTSAAWALARGDAERGRPPCRVLLLEIWHPGHDRGSSHGDGRIVRFTYPEAVYVEMARRAFPLWRQIDQGAKEPLFFQTGSWECGRPGSPQLEEITRSLEQAGLPYRRLSSAESRRNFPHFEVPLGCEVIYQPEGSVVRAGAAVEALWQAAAAAGAEMRREERVLEIVPGEEILVRTEKGVYRTHALVIAAGSWSGPLLRRLDLDLPLAPSREVIAYFSAMTRSFAGMIDHRAGSMPTLIDYTSDPPFYALPQIDVAGVKVGWHHTGPDTDPDEEGEVDDKILRRIQSYVSDRMPFLDLHPLLVKTCLYTNTPDHHFVLDRHPDLPNVVIGSGFSGHGFKFGPVIGEILADLATSRPPGFDLELFRADRFAVGAELKKRSSA